MSQKSFRFTIAHSPTENPLEGECVCVGGRGFVVCLLVYCFKTGLTPLAHTFLLGAGGRRWIQSEDAEEKER